MTEDVLVKLNLGLLWLKLHSIKTRALFASTLELKLRTKLVKCYIWSTALYGAEIWMLWAVDQKQLGSFEMWCWRRIVKIM